MTDAVAVALVGGIVSISGLITTVYLAKIARQGDKAAKEVEKVAKKAEEVKTALEEGAIERQHNAEEVKKALQATNKTQDQKLSSIHTLVNSNMGAQLKISAIALRRVADLTKHPNDVAAADVAEKLLDEHEAKQATVDKKES